MQTCHAPIVHAASMVESAGNGVHAEHLTGKNKWEHTLLSRVFRICPYFRVEPCHKDKKPTRFTSHGPSQMQYKYKESTERSVKLVGCQTSCHRPCGERRRIDSVDVKCAGRLARTILEGGCLLSAKGVPFQGQVHRLPVGIGQRRQAESHQSVGGIVLCITVVAMVECQFIGLVGIGSHQVDGVHLLAAPVGAEAQGQVAVFDYGQPVLHDFHGIRAVGLGEVMGGALIGASEIWYRLPKFILGFFAASLLASFVVLPAAGKETVSAINSVLDQYKNWAFVLAFTSIGLDTNFRELKEQFQGGKPLTLYVVGQLFNIVLTFAAVYLLLSGKFFPLPNLAV